MTSNSEGLDGLLVRRRMLKLNESLKIGHLLSCMKCLKLSILHDQKKEARSKTESIYLSLAVMVTKKRTKKIRHARKEKRGPENH